jgi:hypothetical protein
MKINLFIAAIIVLSMSACKSKKDISETSKIENNTTKESKDNERKKQAVEACAPIVIFTPTIEIAGAAEKGGFPIDTAYIDGNCLVIKSTNTGSAQDIFNVRWNKMVMKSMPPQVSFVTEWLKKSEDGDMTQKTLRYDLAPVYPEVTLPVHIRLTGYDKRIVLGGN